MGRPFLQQVDIFKTGLGQLHVGNKLVHNMYLYYREDCVDLTLDNIYTQNLYIICLYLLFYMYNVCSIYSTYNVLYVSIGWE